MPKKRFAKAKNTNKRVDGQYGSEQDEDDEVATADEYFSKSEGNDSDGGKKEGKISVYCKHTKYVVVKEVGKVH